jgi:hypothetical protein
VLFAERRVIPGDKESPMNKDFYANLKAQAWWMLRRRFERTYYAVTQRAQYDAADLISIPKELITRFDLEKELSQATYATNSRGQLLIDKKPAGARSPNLADAMVMCFWPLRVRKVMI